MSNQVIAQPRSQPLNIDCTVSATLPRVTPHNILYHTCQAYHEPLYTILQQTLQVLTNGACRRLHRGRMNRLVMYTLDALGIGKSWRPLAAGEIRKNKWMWSTRKTLRGRCAMQGTLDGGLSWLVVLSSFMQQFIVMGTHNVFGLFYIELLNEFKKGKAVTAWVGSLSFGMTFLVGPITTTFCKKYGIRTVSLVGAALFSLGLLTTSFVEHIGWMYLTYSIVAGIGASFCYYTSLLILDEYFDKRLVTTNGIALSGAGVGTLALAPVVGYLLNEYSWRGTMRILSIVSSAQLVCSAVQYLVPVPQRERQHDIAENLEVHESKFFDKSLFKNKAYVVWIVVISLVLFGFYIPYVHLVRHCQDLNIPKQTGAMLVGYLAISQTIGKIVFGRIADHPRVNRVYLYQCCLLVCSVVTTLLPIMKTMETVALYCWLFGFHDGCFVLLIAVLTGDIVGKDKMYSAFGIMYFFSCIPMMLGPPVAGWMYEITGTYIPAFFMAGGFTTIGSCLLFLVPVLLPSEIREQWRMRSTRQQVQIPPTIWTAPDVSESTQNWSLSDDEQCKMRNPTFLHTTTNSGHEEEKRLSNLSLVLDKKNSMQHLVSQKDSLLCRVYSKDNLYDNSQPENVRETDV